MLATGEFKGGGGEQRNGAAQHKPLKNKNL